MEKKRIKWHMGWISVAGISASAMCGWILGSSVEPKMEEMCVEVGDVYSYTFNRGNPFEKQETVTYRVIGLKEGFVQYVVDTAGSDTMSTTVGWFLTGSEKIRH